MPKTSKESKSKPLGASVATPKGKECRDMLMLLRALNATLVVQRDAVFTFFTGIRLGLNSKESGE